MHFDELFNQVGQMGRFQLLLSVLGALVSMWSAEVMSTAFIARKIDHWCNTGYSKVDSIPYDYNDTFSQCEQYSPVHGSKVNFTDLKVTCQHGYKYNNSVQSSSAVNRYNLVCEREWLISLSSTFLTFGILIGAIVSGWMSDKIGRRKTILIFVFVKLAGNLVTVVAGIYEVWVLGRFLIGVGACGTYLTMFVLVMEMLGPKYRTAIGVIYQLAFSIGVMIHPIMGYYLRDDRILQIAIGLPNLFFLTYWCLVPESMRWLLVKSKFDEANEVMRKIARYNNKTVSETFEISSIDVVAKADTSTASYFDLFRTPNLRKRTLIIYFHWFTVSLMYYGLSLNTGDLHGNIYINSILSGAVEIPANLITIVLMSWKVTGRRLTSSGSLLAAGASSFMCIPFILYDAGGYATTLAMLGKAFVTIGFSSIYIFSTEIYPTEVRNVGMGSSSVCARVSGMIAPFIGGPMVLIWKPLPYVIFGLTATLAGLFTLGLPETLGENMVDTIEDAELFKSEIKTRKNQDREMSISLEKN